MQTRAVLLSLLCLLAASGCTLAGRTFGRYVDDKALTGAVKLRLATQSPASVARTNVDTFEGQLTVPLVEREPTHGEPLFGFLRRDEIMMVAELFRCGIDGIVVQVHFIFVGLLLGRRTVQKTLPKGIQFPSVKRSLDRIACRVFLATARAHN